MDWFEDIFQGKSALREENRENRENRETPRAKKILQRQFLLKFTGDVNTEPLVELCNE